MKSTSIRTLIRTGIIASIAYASLGCGGDSKKPTIAGRDGDGASQLGARNDFEKSQDPPITAETRFAAGQLAESRSQPDQAIDQYRKALKLDPKHTASMYRLGVVYTQLKQYPQATQVWKQYVAATNGSASAYGNLAFCYQLAGQSDEAEADYKRGIARDSKNQMCRVNFGLMLAAQGRTSEAMEQFQAVLSPAEAHYDVASVYEQQGHKELARVEYRKALDLDPNLTDAQKRLDVLK